MPIPAAGWLCVGLVLLALTLTVVQSRAAARHERYVMEKGRPVLGWIVQAPAALFEPGQTSRPAQILFTFDPAVTDPAALLPELAARLRALRRQPPPEGPSAEVARLVNDQGYRPYERFRLPAAITGGPEVFFAHVYVKRELLPAGVVEVPFVRCRAVPGDDDSRVLMTAYDPGDHRTPRPDPEVACRPDPRSS
jgi:hypothetical protein